MSKEAPGKNSAAAARRHFKRVVGEGEAGLRLDQYLPAVLPEFSRGFWKKALVTGSVHLDGRRMSQCSRIVRCGQQVEVFLDGRPLEKFQLGPEHILFRDEHLLVVNKPAGLDTQPTPARFQGTLYQGLLDYLGRGKSSRRKPEIGMVQRLDRDTSGVLAFSIHPRAHKSLSRQVQQRLATKTYLALVGGCPDPPSGQYSSNLARVRATNLVRSVPRGGQPALTRYRLLLAGTGYSLVEVDLVTGRMHQVRAHFAEAGHPLVGDLRYGGTSLAGCAGRQMLHSWRLALEHPVDGRPLEFVAPLADDFIAASAACGFPREHLIAAGVRQ